MSQCVPNWGLEDLPNSSHGLAINPSSSAATVAAAIGSRSDYEVAELTWVNGHPSMHGLRTGKPVPKYPSPASWDKVLAGGGTLESVVDQATGAILFPQSPTTAVDYDLVPWIPPNTGRGCPSGATASVSAAVLLDALVPCSNRQVLVDDHSTCVGDALGRDGNCRVSGSAASLGLPFDTCHINGGSDDVGFTTSTSPLDGSPDTENTSCGRADTTVDEHDSASQSRRSLRDEACLGDEKRKTGEVVRSSISTKRSRVAAVHNQSERKRRDRINQRMKALQKLVPNSSKTDKASMLDEVIDYVKQLQAQVQMMNRMSTIPHMIMPMPMQQLQMAMMAQMSHMGMVEMATGVDTNPLACPPTQSTSLPTQPMTTQQSTTFFPFVGPSSWDTTRDRVVQPPTVPPVLSTINPFAAFRACQAQKPTNMDTVNRMAAVYQQEYQQPPPPNPNLE